jgi:hypothetical protein
VSELLLAGKFFVELQAVTVGRILQLKVDIACYKFLKSFRIVVDILHLAFTDGFARDTKIAKCLLLSFVE